MESHFIALIFLCIAVTFQESVGHEGIKMQCMGQDFKPRSDNKTLFTHMMECSKEMIEAAGDKAEFKRGPTCNTYCTLKKDGIFDATGHYNATRLKEIAHAYLPTQELADQLVKSVEDCMAKIKKDIKDDDKDYHCECHKGAVCCIMTAWKKTCIKEYHASMDEACL